MTYENGDHYAGTWVDGKRHGEGYFQYSNKDIYNGTWMNGKRHGKGR